MSNKTNILLAHCGREDGNIILYLPKKRQKMKVQTNSEGVNDER